MPSAEATLPEKILYLSLANAIFIFHLSVVVINTLFWLIPSLFYVFLPSVIITIVTDMLFGSCFLSNWEFNLRRKIYPDVIYAPSFINHYAYKFFRIGRKPTAVKKTLPGIKSNLFVLLLFLALSMSLLLKFVIFA